MARLHAVALSPREKAAQNTNANNDLALAVSDALLRESLLPERSVD
jgi:hypothetical protein